MNKKLFRMALLACCISCLRMSNANEISAVTSQGVVSSRPAGAVDTAEISLQIMRELVGDYVLADGRVIAVRELDDGLYVDLNKYERVKLTSVSGNTFFALNGKLCFEFNRSALGGPTVTVGYDDRLKPMIPKFFSRRKLL